MRQYEKSTYVAKAGNRDRRTGSGPRSRSLKAKSGQKDSSGFRNVFPAAAEISNLAKPIGIGAGIYEGEQSTYKMREKTEEDKLFEVNESVRSLLEGLESRNDLEQKNENKT